MTYCLEWRLVGRASRLLDQGEIDGDLADRASALQALHACLATFALRGRSEAGGYWWGRRSADADLEVRVVLRRTVKRDAGHDAGPILISTLTNHTGGEHDIRRTEPAAQGRGGPQGADCDQADPPWGMGPRPGSVGHTCPVRAPAPLGGENGSASWGDVRPLADHGGWTSHCRMGWFGPSRTQNPLVRAAGDLCDGFSPGHRSR